MVYTLIDDKTTPENVQNLAVKPLPCSLQYGSTLVLNILWHQFMVSESTEHSWKLLSIC